MTQQTRYSKEYFPPAPVLVADDWGDRIILGRNVLNLLKLNLDGPGKKISVEI
jgi:hypothetical protein